MAKRGFTVAERWAVYQVHGERCYLCARPIDFQTMEVDHIIPETLLDTPDELAKIIKLFGLKDSFNLNGFENWMPACRACNNGKRAAVFNPSPLIQLQLQNAAKKAPFVTAMASQTVSDIKLSKVLGQLQVAAEQEEIRQEVIDTLVAAFELAREKRIRAEAIARGDMITKDYPVARTPRPAAARPAKAARPASGRYHVTPSPKAKPAAKAAGKPAAAKAPKKAVAKAPSVYPVTKPPFTHPRAFDSGIPRETIRLTPSLCLVYTPSGWKVERSQE
ncbi:HNH endonuclease [Mesorhizobium sp.]|uniref:HNH endonuclease n=1 Tax=Mesorhizobium sp. TaxID=1871066 RepID=UPI000FE605CA|nr:HNH endonuclease [Mesorhizobium sp.]RWE79199.1 MAG: hypothetical protein EOS42_02575 [Mesorhizobium sp.]TIV32260.1 MAG: HNH endonuclease [Mesorhizobium sp.]